MNRALFAVLAVAFACAPAADPPWKVLDAGDGFTVEAPGSPKTEEIKENAPPVGVITGRQYQWQTPSDRFYMAMYMKFPVEVARAGDMTKAMSAMADGIAKRTKGSITSEKPVVVLDLPGIEYEIKMGIKKGSLRIRTVESHGIVYLIAAGWPEGRKSYKDEERFFDSFKLK